MQWYEDGQQPCNRILNTHQKIKLTGPVSKLTYSTFQKTPWTTIQDYNLNWQKVSCYYVWNVKSKMSTSKWIRCVDMGKRLVTANTSWWCRLGLVYKETLHSLSPMLDFDPDSDMLHSRFEIIWLQVPSWKHHELEMLMDLSISL